MCVTRFYVMQLSLRGGRLLADVAIYFYSKYLAMPSFEPIQEGFMVGFRR